MAGLVDGRWVSSAVAEEELRDGAFEREPTRFRGTIEDPEPGRYQLLVSYLCPWASRTLVVRVLKGLEETVPVAVAQPELGDEGWVFDPPADIGPAWETIRNLYRLYVQTDFRYTGKVSVPVLWDRQEGRIVNNESAEIMRLLNTAFDSVTRNDVDLYPAHLRSLIDEWNDRIYTNVNNGVYRAGFARTQAAYDEAVTALFETLDALEERLGAARYLAGEYLTEADWRLFVTLIRFDAAYHGAFKCNLRRIEDYPNLSGYLRELYQWPGIRDTVRIDHIQRGYYSIRSINPTGIVPKGPLLDLDRPHDRQKLFGRGLWRRGMTEAWL